jgi:hypothetical protein
MPNLHLPLSGDVNQTINPWTWFDEIGRLKAKRRSGQTQPVLR